MPYFKLAIALAALASPAATDVYLPESCAEGLTPFLKDYALAHELVDEREIAVLFGKPEGVNAWQFEQFDDTFTVLRERFRELRDAPPLCDCSRYPAKAVLDDLLSFNRDLKMWAEVQARDPVRGRPYEDIVREADLLYSILDKARDAVNDYYHVDVRRRALKRLRGLLGDEAYCDGYLPPHVPLWRMAEIER